MNQIVLVNCFDYQYFIFVASKTTENKYRIILALINFCFQYFTFIASKIRENEYRMILIWLISIINILYLLRRKLEKINIEWFCFDYITFSSKLMNTAEVIFIVIHKMESFCTKFRTGISKSSLDICAREKRLFHFNCL